METGSWVLLSYRIPREPSTPRIAIWRKLKRLGVAQVSDGLVALPAAARAAEYAAVRVQAEAAAQGTDTERAAALRRLRGELRRIGRRDFFPPSERDAARAAVDGLAGPAARPVPRQATTTITTTSEQA